MSNLMYGNPVFSLSGMKLKLLREWQHFQRVPNWRTIQYVFLYSSSQQRRISTLIPR